MGKKFKHKNQNYKKLDSVETDPSPIVPGQNYKLRGPIGNSVLITGITSSVLCVASISMLLAFRFAPSSEEEVKLFIGETPPPTSSDVSATF